MPIITDANVLIDYCQSDLSILGLYSRHVETVWIPSQIFDEVEQLSASECDHYGLMIMEEPLEVLLKAGERRGPLSFPDRVCLYLAQKEHLTCITNEKPLHRACREEGIVSRWGLWLMLQLVEQGHLERQSAEDVAWQIHETNPLYVHQDIVRQFIDKLGTMGRDA